MPTIEIGHEVPNFELPSTDKMPFRLSDYRGKNVIIYFYPKDNTAGCTLEGQSFRDNIKDFDIFNTVIFGISRDSLKKHKNFKDKYDFPFELLSDENEDACHLFNVLHLKKNYGREYIGIVRSTFLIDKNGVLRNEWRKVKVKEHIAEVLEAVKQL